MKLNTFIKYVRRFPDIRMNSNCVTLYRPYFCKADPIENKYIKCFDTKYIRNLFYCSDIADGPMRHFTAYDSDTIDNCSLQLKKSDTGKSLCSRKSRFRYGIFRCRRITHAIPKSLFSSLSVLSIHHVYTAFSKK